MTLIFIAEQNLVEIRMLRFRRLVIHMTRRCVKTEIRKTGST